MMRNDQHPLFSSVRAVFILLLAGFLALAENLHAAEKRWQTLGNIPVLQRRTGFTLNEFRDRLWVIGGQGCAGTPGFCGNILTSEDGRQWSAVQAPAAVSGRTQHAAVILENELFVIGGKNAQNALLGDIWKTSDGVNWIQVATLADFGPRHSHSVTLHDGQLWLIGGEKSSGLPTEYDADIWTSRDGVGWQQFWHAEFPPVRRHGMVSHEGILYVIGGDTFGQGTWTPAKNWYLLPGTNLWEELVLPYPYHFYRFQSPVSWNGELWLSSSSNANVSGAPAGVELRVLRRTAYGELVFVPSLHELRYPEFHNQKAEMALTPFKGELYRLQTFFETGSGNGNGFITGTYHRLVASGNHGTVSFETPNPASDGYYPAGTEGQLVPHPENGYVFVGWSGDAQGDVNPHPLVLDRDKTVTALFEPAFPVVTVLVTGSGRSGPSGAVPVRRGTDLALTLRPEPGSRVLSIKVDGVQAEIRSPFVLSRVVANHQVEIVFTSCSPAALAPNHIVIKTYADDGAAPVTRYLVPDGFGEAAQSQLDLGGGSFLVGATVEDGAGLPTKEVKPYVAEGRSAFVFDPMECEDVVRRANDYYNGESDEQPDAERHAYSEVRYALEPATRAEAYGMPGLPFSADADLGGHPTRLWRFGATGPEAFLGAADLTETALDARTSPDGSQYSLTVIRDGNGHFSQAIEDAFGNPIARWGNPDPTDDDARSVSRAEFDVVGRLTREIPPLGEDYQGLVERTLAGEMRFESTADGGATEFRHDTDGRVRFVKTARHRALDLEEPAKQHYLRMAYDALGRLLAVSDNNGTHSFDAPDAPFTSVEGDSVLLKRFYFDAFSAADLHALGLQAPAGVLDDVARELHIGAGQLAAAVAFGPGARKTVDLFSYDARGLVAARYRFLPGGVPVQKFESSTDAAGKPLEEVYYSGYDPDTDIWTAENLRTTLYDALDRPEQVDIDGHPRFAYSYQMNGALSGETLYAPGGTQTLEELHYAYTAQDWMRRLSTTGQSPRFSVDLDYAGQYNGNIGGTRYAYQLGANDRREKDYAFGYDGLDRVTEALTPAGVAASYGYDAQGRLTRKEEEGSTLSAYDYAPGKNQVVRVPGHLYKGHPNAYVYDPEGNMVMDRSKRMTIDYDALGQAVAFRVYQAIPEAIFTWEDVRDNRLETLHGATLLEKTEMAYDAFGQRVFKHHKSQTVESAVAYVGDAAELSSPDGDGPWTVAAVNHWTGTGLRGRRVAAGEYTYLTDHMGSVRMGLNAAGGVVEALDYTLYGMPLRMLGNGAMARQGYTEKERDSETGLTYFGARYLDAELGGWTMVDPMEQYHSGYSFVGGNPVNFIDPWGMEGEPADGGDWDDSFWDFFQDRGGTWNDGSQQEAGQQADASNVTITPPTRYFDSAVIREAADPGERIPDYTDFLQSDPNFLMSKRAAKDAPEVITTAASLTPWGFTEGALLRMGQLGKWLLRTKKSEGVIANGISGASSALNGARLSRHLTQLEKYGKAGFKELQNGRIRYYSELTKASKPGGMAGRRVVREWNPATNGNRTWMETLDHSGRVRIVRPETGGAKIHFMFDELGNFKGSF
jgi:RHS repeat-associated protein